MTDDRIEPTFSSLLRDLELMERDLRPEASGLPRELAIDMALAENDNTEDAR